MKLEIIKELNRVYEIKMNEEDYKNDMTNDVYRFTKTLITLAPMLGSKADEQTFGEFTRRFNLKMEELLQLIKS